jgi:hypothetical protein
MNNLQEEYGKKKGEKIYLEMKKDRTEAFDKGMRTSLQHGHQTIYKIKYRK